MNCWVSHRDQFGSLAGIEVSITWSKDPKIEKNSLKFNLEVSRRTRVRNSVLIIFHLCS